MPLRHTAAPAGLAQGQHVPAEIQAGIRQQGIDPLCHGPVPAVAGLPKGGKKLIQQLDPVVGYRLNGHIADPRLIRIVGPPSLQPCARHVYPALHADGSRYPRDLRRRQKFPCPGDRVVVDNPCRTQAFGPAAGE